MNITFKPILPSFSSRLPEGDFSDIRNIPNIRCALCAKPMLTKAQCDSFIYRSSVDFQKMAKEMMAQIPDEIKKSRPKGCAYVSAYIKEHGADGLEQFYKKCLTMPNIPEQGKNESAQIRDILGYICILSKAKKLPKKLSNEEILKKLENIVDIMPDGHRKCFELLKSYCEIFPDSSFCEIVNDKTLYNYHLLIASRLRQQNHKALQEAYQKMLSEGAALSENQQKELLKTTDSVLNVASHSTSNPEIRRAYINKLGADFLENVEDENLRMKLDEMFKNFPLYITSADAVFAKFHELQPMSDFDVIKIFVSDAESSYEHVKPRSAGGPNGVGNGLYMHSGCNRNRDTVPYTVVSTVYPDFEQNIQNQVNRITSFVLAGKLQRYADWPNDIRRTLHDEAKIYIKTPKAYLKRTQKD